MSSRLLKENSRPETSTRTPGRGCELGCVSHSAQPKVWSTREPDLSKWQFSFSNTNELKFPVVHPNSRSVKRTNYPPFMKFNGVYGILRTIIRNGFILGHTFMPGSPVPFLGNTQTARNNTVNNDDENDQQCLPQNIC